MTDAIVEREIARRHELWSLLKKQPSERMAAARTLSEVGLRPYGTTHGIFRDKVNTETVSPPYGVTLSVLHTGTSYEDAFDDECGLYRYPQTKRPGRDKGEIEATKSAGTLAIPVFVIVRTADRKSAFVRLGWVADWDDAAGVFLIDFGVLASSTPQEPEFVLRARTRRLRIAPMVVRPGQPRFRFGVVKRYGPACVVCGMSVPALLEAVHLCSVAEGGVDDPRNGFVLCRNHHAAFDERLFGIEPSTLSVAARSVGPSCAELGITVSNLAHLGALPHAQALEWCWKAFLSAQSDQEVVPVGD